MYPESVIDPFKRFIHYLTVEKGLAANTLEAYERDLRKFVDYIAESGISITALSRKDIASFMERLRDSGHKTSTLARYVASIRGFCKFLLMEKIIDEDPVENYATPKGWKHIPKIMGFSEVSDLLKRPSGKKLSLRDRAMLEIIYSSGLRVSEVATLKVQDIHFEAGFLTVKGKGSKERVVPVNEKTLETLKEYIDTSRAELLKNRHSPYLFIARGGKPLTRQRLWQLVKLYSSGLSIEVSPHTLRHCFASHLLDGGADLRALQKMLGHTDISTTQIYTKVTPERLRKVHKQHHPRG